MKADVLVKQVPHVVKCRIAESLLSCGELFNLKQDLTCEVDKEVVLRAIHSNGAIVKELLATYGLAPEQGAKIYTEIMNTESNGSREIYHKMTDKQKSEILVINSKQYI